MPQILDAAVKAIKKSSPNVNPWAVGTAALQKSGELKAGTNKPTKLGIKRGKMSRAQRHAKPLAIGGAAKKPSLGR
jgi:hypothetical protein